MAGAKGIWDITEVNQRVEDKEKGYQRALSVARAKKIGGHIDAGKAIPNSVFISFRKAKLSPDGKRITIPNRPNAGWIIDGQHRLTGAHFAKTDISLPVVACVGLETTEQIEHFVTINREQVGVPSSLYFELLKHLPKSKTEAEITQERAADIANLLKKDEASPFYGKIVTVTAPREGELSLTNFVRKVAPMLKRDGRLSIYSDDERSGIISNFYRAIEHVFPKEYQRRDSIFFMTVGFGALMNLLPNVLDLTLSSSGRFRVGDVIRILEAVKHFDFAGWHQIGTGNAAELQAADDLRQQLRDAQETKTIPTTIELS